MSFALRRLASLLLLLAGLGHGCAHGIPAVAPEAMLQNDRGAELLAEGELEDAEAALRLALEYHSRFAEAHLNLALVLMAKGELVEAEEHLVVAIELDEDFAEAHTNLGVLYVLRGATPSAEREFTAALAIDPGLREPRLNLAMLYVRREAYPEARAHLLRLVQLLPEDDEANGWLAYAELMVRRPAEARARAEGVVERTPGQPVANVVLAMLALESRDWSAVQTHAALAWSHPETHELALVCLLASAAAQRDPAQVRRYVDAYDAEITDAPELARLEESIAQLRRWLDEEESTAASPEAFQ